MSPRPGHRSVERLERCRKRLDGTRQGRVGKDAMRLWLMVSIAVLAAGIATARADSLLLQQNLPGNVAGAPFLLIERDRISHVEVHKETSLSHELTIHLATDPPVRIALVCNDEAITRQVLESLRRGATASLDITGRCQL